ncbi:MAG: menaquinone biosynthesis protein [Bacteroidota bacterium]
MELLRISAVSYLNTFPFVYGLKESGILTNFTLSLQVPSLCAEQLKNGNADLALVPVAALPEIGQYHFVSDYCIGAVGEVKTVLLLSKVPINQITRVFLDFDSRTSVELVKLLARRFWHIEPAWEKLKSGEAESQHDIEALVAIGDKTFRIREDFPYVYDLASEWIRFTGLPFVFAAWVSRKKLGEEAVDLFTRAIAHGVNNKPACIEYFRDKLPAYENCLAYLEDNISFEFDKRKKEGLALFLNYLK